MEKQARELKVMVETHKSKEGREFNTFKLVQDNGRLVDLRFKQGNDTTEIAKCNKCRVVVEELKDASRYYEYPRFYANGIVSVDKIN